MTDWNTYRIQDFLLFSREILFEVIEAYNYDLWPWQLLWFALAGLILALLLFPSPARSRIHFGLAAAAWTWVGLVYHLQYFLPINWAARYSAGLFLFEAGLLLLSGVILGRLPPAAPGPRRTFGIAVFILAAFIPIELMLGQNLAQIMIFGWGPERTALGTLGLLLTARPGFHNRLLMLPALFWGLIAVLMFYGLK